MHPLRRYLTRFAPITDEQFAQVLPFTNEYVSLKKGDYFLKAGEIAKRMGLIVEGVMGNYCVEKQTETIQYFLTTNEVAANPESFDLKVVSKVSIRALTPCQLLVVNQATFWKLVEAIPWWGELTRVIGSIVLTERLKKHSKLMTKPPTERYAQFAEENPAILQHVPLGLIATYLGLHQASLSRIRRQMMEASKRNLTHVK